MRKAALDAWRKRRSANSNASRANLRAFQKISGHFSPPDRDDTIVSAGQMTHLLELGFETPNILLITSNNCKNSQK